MAYQARTRDPLFDSETQAVLERRARELVGLLMLVAGVIVAMILGSYAPEDPSWLSVTDAMMIRIQSAPRVRVSAT